MKNIQSGFTLLEVIVAITIAGFIMMGLVVLVTNLNSISARSYDLRLANSTAENKFEDLRSSTFLGLSDGTYDFTSELPANLGNPKSAVYTVADSSLAGVSSAVKEINMTITYESYGKTQSLEYSGYIGELGVGQY